MRFRLVMLLAGLALVSACRSPYSTVYYGKWPKGLYHIRAEGGDQNELSASYKSLCLAIHDKSEIMFLGNSRFIGRRTLGGIDLESIRQIKQADGLAVDQKAGYLYVADSGAKMIFRCDLDGENRLVIRKDVPFAKSVAVDCVGQKVYWIQERSIWMANSDGTDAKSIFVGNGPQAITVDSVGKRIYWTKRFNSGSGQIVRARLDGTGIEVVAQEGLAPWLEELAVDPIAKRIYWTGRYPNGISPARIRSAKLDGSDIKTLVTFDSQQHSRSMTLGRLATPLNRH